MDSIFYIEEIAGMYEACSLLLNAINQYNCSCFESAHACLKEYREFYNGKIFNQLKYKKLLHAVPELSEDSISVVIVTNSDSSDKNFQECLKSIFNQILPPSEIIILFNGSNASHDELNQVLQSCFSCADISIKIMCFPLNIFPSEARNIGAYLASASWVLFVDDDGILDNNHCLNASELISSKNIIAARGKVLPKNLKTPVPPHYDLGEYTRTAKINIEGNLLFNRNIFLRFGKFNPLLFHHEGIELYSRLISLFDLNKFVYCPTMVLFHEPSLGIRSSLKQTRAMISNSYLESKSKKDLDADMAPKISLVLNYLGDNSSILNALFQISLNCKDFSFQEVVIVDTSGDLKLKDIEHFCPYLKIKIARSSGFLNFILSRHNNVSCLFFNQYRNISAQLIESVLSNYCFHIGENIVEKLPQIKSQNFCIDFSDLSGDDRNHSIDSLVKFLLSYDVSEEEYKKPALVVSFYTPDDYYKEKSDQLKYCLERLQLDYFISEIKIPEGLSWPDICRKKVKFMRDAFVSNKDKYEKIIWMDVDCSLEKFPSFITDFDVDLMGFARGFSHSGHKKRVTTRFWEPCFFVFSVNSRTEEFLQTAANLEEEMSNIQATDDYFIEEAWRRHKDNLTYFAIPGEYCDRRANEELLISQYRVNGIFFLFGESGNVSNFKGKVVQHLPAQAQPAPTFSKPKPSRSVNQLLRLIDLPKSQLLTINHTISLGCSEIEREQAKSLKTYESDGPHIPLFWWIRPAPGNMGDWLSPYIISKLFGIPVKYAASSKAKLVSLGSIGKFVEDHHVAWGTGISNSDTELSSKASFLAVRGPYTSEALLKSGGKRVDVFGDPGILMNRIFKPKSFNQKRYRYGFVRHYIHQNVPISLGNDIEDLNIMMSSPADLENFIARLCSYEAVLTTSLHVIILCHAYKIPCRLISLAGEINRVHGNGIKYKDFYHGAGIKYLEHACIGSSLSGSDFESLADNTFAPDYYGDGLVDSFKSQLEKDPESLIQFQ